jgi:hypothetical protein
LELLKSVALRELVENAQNIWRRSRKMELLNFDCNRTKAPQLKLFLGYD